MQGFNRQARLFEFVGSAFILFTTLISHNASASKLPEQLSLELTRFLHSGLEEGQVPRNPTDLRRTLEARIGEFFASKDETTIGLLHDEEVQEQLRDLTNNVVSSEIISPRRGSRCSECGWSSSSFDSFKQPIRSWSVDSFKQPLYHFKADVIVLNQIHFVDSPGLSVDKAQEITNSQFQIAQYLLRNPGLEVFTEGCVSDMEHGKPTFKDVRQDLENRAKQAIVSTFPSGSIPQNLNDFSPEQKDALMRYGAAKVLFYLNKLPRIRATSSTEEESRFNTEICDEKTSNRERCSIIIDDREIVTIKKIKDYLDLVDSSDSRPIILIYGANHDFLKYSQASMMMNFRDINLSGIPDMTLRKNRQLIKRQGIFP